MKKTIIALALALSAAGAHADQGDITVHTLSMHFGSNADQMNNINPGIAYDIRDDLRVGALYNSYYKPSLYVAKVIRLNRRLSAGLGVISGYKWSSQERDVVGETYSIIPMLAVEARISDNVSVLWFGQAFNLQVRF